MRKKKGRVQKSWTDDQTKKGFDISISPRDCVCSYKLNIAPGLKIGNVHVIAIPWEGVPFLFCEGQTLFPRREASHFDFH